MWNGFLMNVLNLLINELSDSPNFACTHEIMSKLRKYPDFSPSQIRRLVDIGLTNSQVSWIADDADVNQFYRKLVDGKTDLIDPETLATFTEFYLKSKEDDEKEDQEDINVDEIPF